MSNLPKFILLRLLHLIPVLLVVIVVNFALIQASPGDVAIVLAGENADPEYMQHIRELYGLDQPFPVQLARYLGQVLQGDLGRSFQSRAPVFNELMQRVPATLLLVGTALLLAVVIGTWLGSLAARRPGSPFDIIATTLSVALYSIPVFWLGLMLIIALGVNLRWLPVSGMQSVGSDRVGLQLAFDVARHMVLPVLTLSAVWMGQYVRLARTSVEAVMSEDYITTVRAIGFPSRRILLHYAQRNALLPVVTVVGLQMGLVLTGAVLTETVFAWPGLGRYLYDAILARDTPVIMGGYVVMSVCVALASLITDIVYALLDPRVRM
jgi:peptide/nickel transport system permease protein